MTKIIGVRFGKAGKAYYFDTSGLSLKVGDEVVVETAHGAEIGIVSTPERETENEDPENPSKPVIRKATEKDLQDAQESKQREAEAFETCQQKIEKLGLDMKLINVEYALTAARSSSISPQTAESISVNSSKSLPAFSKHALSCVRSAFAMRQSSSVV